MKLSKQDADLFFELIWGLQFFVNQQLRVLPDIQTLDAYCERSAEEKSQVREALYANIELIDDFIEENPYHFSKQKLGIVEKWKRSISGEFFIERLLKKYAIFISSDNTVYGVLALHDPFQDMFHPRQMPVYVKAVLLPFKGRIIYDGVLQGYNIFFGRGVSSELKETYMAAKQHGRIIESLEPEGGQPKAPKSRKPGKDWRPELDELMAKAKKLRASSDQLPVSSSAFSLIKASLELAQFAVHNPNDLDGLWRCLQKVNRASGRVETILHRSERYRSI